jgi:hypothetical protein
MAKEKINRYGKHVASKLEKRLHKLREAETSVGEAIARENYRRAAKSARDAHKIAIDVLESALQVARQTPTVPAAHLPIDVIRKAEERLGVEDGTFAGVFKTDVEIAKLLTHNAADDLERVLDSLRDQKIPAKIYDVPEWVPRLTRIISAVAVGTLVAAPLSALAVRESVFSEVIKALVAGSVVAFSEFYVGPKIDSKFKDSER